ncbi:MAG: hypothetical protein AABX11_05625 [Nanoarchaeota archaeon]
MKKEIPIEQRFLKEMMRSILFAIKKEKKKKFVSFSHPVLSIESRNIRPGIIELASQDQELPMGEHSTNPRKITTIESNIPRIILTQKRIPLSQSPIVTPGREINLTNQGHPVPHSMFPVEPTLTMSIRQLISDKIKNILLDPGVFSVECPGPSKPLIVTAGGMVRSTNIIFTEEEITSFMNDISQKTRIPILPGLYKAVFGNLLIIAVVSEFVGTRFLIQKRA